MAGADTKCDASPASSEATTIAATDEQARANAKQGCQALKAAALVCVTPEDKVRVNASPIHAVEPKKLLAIEPPSTATPPGSSGSGQGPSPTTTDTTASSKPRGKLGKQKPKQLKKRKSFKGGRGKKAAVKSKARKPLETKSKLAETTQQPPVQPLQGSTPAAATSDAHGSNASLPAPLNTSPKPAEVTLPKQQPQQPLALAAQEKQDQATADKPASTKLETKQEPKVEPKIEPPATPLPAAPSDPRVAAMLSRANTTEQLGGGTADLSTIQALVQKSVEASLQAQGDKTKKKGRDKESHNRKMRFYRSLESSLAWSS